MPRGRGGRGGRGRGGRGGPRGGPGRGPTKNAPPISKPTKPIPYSANEILKIWNRYVPSTDDILDVQKMIFYHSSLHKECTEEDAEAMIDAFLNGSEAKDESDPTTTTAPPATTTTIEEEDEDEDEDGPHITFDQFCRLYPIRAGEAAAHAIKASIEMIQNKNDFGEDLLRVAKLDEEHRLEQIETIEHIIKNIESDPEQLDRYVETMVEKLSKRVPVQSNSSVLKMNISSPEQIPLHPTMPRGEGGHMRTLSSRGSMGRNLVHPESNHVRTLSSRGSMGTGLKHPKKNNSGKFERQYSTKGTMRRKKSGSSRGSVVKPPPAPSTPLVSKLSAQEIVNF